MSTPAIAAIDQTAVGSRAIFMLRRAAARTLDGTLIAIPIVGVVGVGMFTFAAAALGAGTAVGGDGGLLVGVGVAMLLQFVLFVAGVVLSVLIPLLYFRWAARRGGPQQGQTLGRQLLGLRLSRTGSERPVRGRTMLLREFAIALWFIPVAIVGGLAGGLTNSSALATFAQLAAVVAVLWVCRDGILPHDRITRTEIGDDWAAR